MPNASAAIASETVTPPAYTSHPAERRLELVVLVIQQLLDLLQHVASLPRLRQPSGQLGHLPRTARTRRRPLHHEAADPAAVRRRLRGTDRRDDDDDRLVAVVRQVLVEIEIAPPPVSDG